MAKIPKKLGCLLALSMGFQCWASSLKEAWKNEVLYQVMVDRYENGDTSNDQRVDKKNHTQLQGGDLKGLIKRLDYITSLGASGVVLSPITSTAAYHGYHVLDINKIEEAFGNEEDLKNLIVQAHSRGLKVMFDLVLNHVDSSSKLFQEKPSWFREKKGSKALNAGLTLEVWNKLSFFELPDLDHSNNEVYEYLLSAAKKWASFGIDAFRMDAVTLIEPSFWARFNAELKREFPKLLILGEVFTTDKKILESYIPHFDAYFDFRFYSTIASVLVDDAHPLYWLLANETRFGDSMKFRFFESHDVKRLISRLELKNTDPSRLKKKMNLALSVLLLSPGVPVLFYGVESGLRDDPQIISKDLLFDSSRTPMHFVSGESEWTKIIKRLSQLRKSLVKSFDRCEESTDNGLERLFVRFCSSKDKKLQSLTFHNFSNRRIDRNFLLHRYFPQPPKFYSILQENQRRKVTHHKIPLKLKPYQSLSLVFKKP